MLLVPAVHVTTLQDLPTDLATGWLTATTALSNAVRSAFHATGVTIRMNLGPPGQDIAHLHTHVIPRHPGDELPTTRSQNVPLADRIAITHRLRPHLDAHRATGDPGALP
ncbi:diadenosine tetraphosphate (Ap4A) HIT family hydrolase [Hamadaea flava]|nr:diadenosine tetraphosphate (Ap4A) HIT family hydrolase [Hamadaea flava]